MPDGNRRNLWLGTLLAAAMLLIVTAGQALADDPTPAATGAAAPIGWPQFRGPNGDSIAPSSPKLLDTWPKAGPPLVWKSDALPFAPICGVGSPVVAGGKVYAYAQVALPMEGVKPFNAEFFAHWGWAEGMSDELCKKVEAAMADKKYAEARKTPDALEACIKEILASLDPDQAAKFGDAIRTRIKVNSFDYANLAWMIAMKDQDVKTRQEFINLFIDRYHHTIYHSNQAEFIIKHADKVYKDQKWADQIVCLDGATGKTVWTKELPGAQKSWGVEFGCSGVPTIVKDKLYFAGSGGVYCIDISKKGELVWQGKGEGSCTSPVVCDGVVYCCPGDLAAFDAATGKLLWRQPKVRHDTASPVVWKNNGKTYVICADAEPRYYYNIFCMNADDGTVVWQEPAGGGNCALAIQGDTMVARANGGCTAYRLTLPKPEKLWTSKEGGDYGGSPIIYKDHVYACGHAYGSDVDTVLDLKTGAVTLKQATKGGACSTGAIADGKIIFVCDSGYKVGRLIVFKTTPDKFEEVGELPNQDVVACTSPAFADGKVFVRMPTAIACYDLAEHQP